MPPYTTAQKQAIAQFVNLTNSKDTIAVKALRATGWNLERAIDSFFGSSAGPSKSTKFLNEVFDSYRDDPEDSPDGIGIDGAMKFLGDIQVQLDEVACLAIFEMCKCPSMGEFSREGFVEGWKTTQCESHDAMANHVKYLRTNIPKDSDLFRRVYRFTFPLSRMQGQRNLQFEIAEEQWKLLFTADRGGVPWNTATTPWLDWWIEFLEGRGKKPVNKDLWEQTEVFMRKTFEDENFGWWSPDGAWPGALDDFVGFVKGKRGQGSEMEVE
ncbi:hypothetical protein PENSTE_c004G08986 [Penicillium steckii]|uniref:Defective in cullin neddylation protein n=1 Tax=Penicillium steckii TaxID=303698 RepID=A0A1V6TNU8_9EURO|nr:hypothetical protein PENSTE_c004G08986 [Penicillium steckii]